MNIINYSSKESNPKYYQLNLKYNKKPILISTEEKQKIEETIRMGFEYINLKDIFFSVKEISSISKIEEEMYYGKYLVREPGLYYINDDGQKVYLPNKEGIKFKNIFEEEIKKREIEAGRGGQYLETKEKTGLQRDLEATRKKYNNN